MTDAVKSWIEERRTIHRDGWTGKWSWSLNNRDLATLRATGGHVDFDLIRDDVFRGSSEVLDEIIDAHNVTVPRALNALEQVLEVHRRAVDIFEPSEFCAACSTDQRTAGWPCATVQAIEGAINE
ncbi:hypothetical protein [Brevibacterium linens]|uniref:Uncharacterized protein n=1 Tax=Brevibacterium linens TaxID=1703 RepID=A0A0B9A1A3_BRELN|nr:hypothetical protein [Brevibacterium linens]KHS52570.1 hypothetical protein AE0388_1553 [Brevibacterium linens]